MHVQWFGNTCLKIQSNGATVVIDPYKIGNLKSPRMAADVLLLTSQDFFGASSSVSGDKFLIDSPGEYEVKNIMITALSSNGNGDTKAQTFYYLDLHGISVAHLGRAQKGQLSDKQLEMLENVDLLFVPVGGSNAVDAKGAAQLVSQIDPKIVVPIYYSTTKLKMKLDSLDKFIKEMSVKSESTDKISLKAKDLPVDDMKMIILQPSV
ncbi:MAG: MBL fold metallo-hydrolase [Candidatus Komeilibacteria bacterium]